MSQPSGKSEDDDPIGGAHEVFESAPVVERASPYEERRAHERLALKLDAKIEILLPEETFRPHAFPGWTLDVSIRGMKLFLKGLPKSLYLKLHSRPRVARVELEDAGLGGQFRIVGKIMWWDFHNAAGSPEGDCMIGLLVDDQDAVAVQKYSVFVERLKDRLRDI